MASSQDELDIDPIEEFSKVSRSPNLFTMLEISGKEIDSVVEINALDIVAIVESIVNEYLNKLDDESGQGSEKGSGSKDNPYSFSTPLEWLLAAKNYKITEEPKKYKYFKIGGQIIDISMNDRYASSENNYPDDFYEFMHDTVNQYLVHFNNPIIFNELKGIFLKSESAVEADKLRFIFTFVFHLIQNMEAKHITSGYYLYLISKEDSEKNRQFSQTPCLIYKDKDTPFQLILKNKEGNLIEINFEQEQDKTIVEHFHRLIESPCKEKREKVFLSSFTEIMRYIALKGGYESFSAGEEWHRPPYKGQLAKDEEAAQGYVEKKISQLNSASMESLTKQMDVEIDPSSFADDMPDFSKMPLPSIIDNISPASSTDKDEFKKGMQRVVAAITETLATLKKDNTRRTTPRAMFNKFIKQVTEKVSPELQEDEIPTFDLDSLIKTVSDQFEKGFLDKSGLDSIKVLGNMFTVLEIRDILANTVKKPNKHLPVTVASLFFSETSRSFLQGKPGCLIVFPAALALLDLIQTQQLCPDCDETYTPLNLLRTPQQRTKFVDLYGKVYSKEEDKNLRDKLEKKYASRLEVLKQRNQKKYDKERSKIFSPVKELIPGDVLYNVSGYHPMVHGGSNTEVENKTNPIHLTLVDQKGASILLQWLSLHLKSQGYEVKLEKKLFNNSWTLKTERTNEKRLIEDFIRKRLETFDCLLPKSSLILDETGRSDQKDFSSNGTNFPAVMQSLLTTLSQNSRKAAAETSLAPLRYSSMEILASLKRLTSLEWIYNDSLQRYFLSSSKDISSIKKFLTVHKIKFETKPMGIFIKKNEINLNNIITTKSSVFPYATSQLSTSRVPTSNAIIQPMKSTDDPLFDLSTTTMQYEQDIQITIWRSLNELSAKEIESDKLFGLTPYDVDYEVGNCLFDAIQEASNHQFSGVHEVRMAAISRLQSDPQLQEHLQVISSQDEDKLKLHDGSLVDFHTPQEYIRCMSDNKTWGTYLEIVALSRSLQRPIVIFSQILAYPHIVELDSYSNNVPIFIQRIGEHYQPMVVPASRSSIEILGEIRNHIQNEQSAGNIAAQPVQTRAELEEARIQFQADEIERFKMRGGK